MIGHVYEDVDEGLGRYVPAFCPSLGTNEYVDVWGRRHHVCTDPTHVRRLKAQYPDRIQKSIYEDVRRQDSLLPTGSIGGTLRPDVDVFDDSDYRSRK